MKGIVYILTNGDHHKIGYTHNDPRSRQWGCQVGESDRDLRLVLTMTVEAPDLVEKELHRLFWHKKTRNDKVTGEWFDLSEDDIKATKERYNGTRNDKHQVSVDWNPAYYVRPIRGRQLDAVANGGAHVSGRSERFGYPFAQPVQPPVR
jgi:hypothetical protein